MRVHRVYTPLPKDYNRSSEGFDQLTPRDQYQGWGKKLNRKLNGRRESPEPLSLRLVGYGFFFLQVQKDNVRNRTLWCFVLRPSCSACTSGLERCTLSRSGSDCDHFSHVVESRGKSTPFGRNARVSELRVSIPTQALILESRAICCLEKKYRKGTNTLHPIA